LREWTSCRRPSLLPGPGSRPVLRHHQYPRPTPVVIPTPGTQLVLHPADPDVTVELEVGRSLALEHEAGHRIQAHGVSLRGRPATPPPAALAVLPAPSVSVDGRSPAGRAGSTRLRVFPVRLTRSPP